MQNILRDLGLSPKEIKVYEALLKRRSASPAVLATATKISRPTVYSLTKSLATKGLVVESVGSKKKMFTIVPSHELTHLAEKERAELKRKEHLLETLSKELEIFKIDSTYPLPSIRFIEESDIASFMRTRTPLWNESMLQTSPTWWGFQDHTFAEQFLSYIEWLWKNSPEKIDLKLLSNASEIETSLRGKFPQRNIKFWNGVLQFTATTWILGEYVVLVNTKTHPFYLTEIHDPLLAQNLRAVFENLWRLVP